MALSTIPTRALTEQGINFRNLIINGDMSVAQRGTQAVGGITGLHYGGCDRLRVYQETTASAYTLSQDTNVPTAQGFAKSFKLDVTTADASLDAGDRVDLIYRFEGQELQHIKKGTSSAESLTLSFWVSSPKTGTHIVELFDSDNTRQISKSYTVSSANTWEKKTITFEGDTSGALNNDNNLSLQISWWLMAGSNYTSGTLSTSWTSNTNANRAVGQVNVMDSTSNNFYLTGVQLEVGTSASDFEFIPNTMNILRCQRYFYTLVNDISQSFAVGTYYHSSLITTHIPFPTTMRAKPTVTHSTGTNYYVAYSNNQADGFDGFHAMPRGSINAIALDSLNLGASGTSGHGCSLSTNDSSAYIFIEAEL